ncbi:MAG TPA: toll/interleukin-1 receptor domain-containing protein [Pyrinomonadaceae bacterium]|jgi:hypothetical protein
MVKVFFSYSHRDESLRDELEVHLSALKRQGIIDTWHDRRIGSGKEFDSEISQNLEDASIILLLVSPYFIASDYCYDVEMTHALKKHKEGTACVIPVILHPCDWHRLPFGKLLATPRDGKAISKHPNQHDAFLEITLAIRKTAEELNPKLAATINQSVNQTNKIQTKKIVSDVRSSNLRIKKTFSERDKDKFEREAFEYMSNFFEGSLQELQVRNAEIETEFIRVDANNFTAKVYINGTLANNCKIGLDEARNYFGGITYSSGRNNGVNESLNVDEDGYKLFLKSAGFSSFGGNNKEELSKEGASEFYWEKFIRPLQQ